MSSTENVTITLRAREVRCGDRIANLSGQVVRIDRLRNGIITFTTQFGTTFTRRDDENVQVR